MRRRAFIAGLGGAALWPLAVQSQPVEGVRRVGVLVPFGPGDAEGEARLRAFSQGLEAAGWIAGHNVHIDTRYGNSDAELMRRHALDLVSLAPHAIFVQSSPLVAHLKRATQKIPIVFVNVADPVEAGFVTSLARPGGNITGFSNFEDAIAGKWLELLRAMSPATERVLFVMNERNPSNPRFFKVVEAIAPSMGVQLIPAKIHDAKSIQAAITSFAATPAGGLIVAPDNLATQNRERIVALAAQHRLPAVYVFRIFVTTGGLMSYGIDVPDIFRKAAAYVDRVLRGAAVGELPVQAPTKFEFTVNLKVARTLGLNPPPSLVALADEVIE